MHRLRLVVSPIILKVLYISGVLPIGTFESMMFLFRFGGIWMDMSSFPGGGVPTFSSKTKSHWFEVHWTMATVFEAWPRPL